MYSVISQRAVPGSTRKSKDGLIIVLYLVFAISGLLAIHGLSGGSDARSSGFEIASAL